MEQEVEMILIWLGSFFLMVFSLNESQKAFAWLFSPVQKKIFEKSFAVALPSLLPRIFCLVASEGSAQKSMLTGLALYNLRILGKRASILMMGLSNLGAWWALLLAALFMNVNGAVLLGVSALGLISFLKFQKLDQVLKLIFWVGLFLLGSEMMIRHSFELQALLGESDFAFWLADGRGPAVLGMFLLSLLVSAAIQFEFWSLCLALALLLTSVVSFNGALALVAGERAARALIFIWRGARLNQDCRRVARLMGWASFVGAFAGLWSALIFREFAHLGASFGLAEGQGRSLDFVFVTAILLLTQSVAQMLAGHFIAAQEVSEVQEARYFPVSWMHEGLLSEAAVTWGQTQISKRVQEIRYHILGLENLKKEQVPDHLRLRLQTEEQELVRLQTYLRR